MFKFLQVDIGDVVEMWFIDEGIAFDVSHPFHVHGTDFYVVAMERHGLNNSFIGPGPYEGIFLIMHKLKKRIYEWKILTQVIGFSKKM